MGQHFLRRARSCVITSQSLGKFGVYSRAVWRRGAPSLGAMRGHVGYRDELRAITRATDVGAGGGMTAPGKPTRKRYTHAELHKIIEAHHKFRTGRAGGVRALLAFADLSGLAMAGCNLSEADLSGATLRGANLSDCNLDRATLFGADMRDSDLEGASLIGANLRGATLRGANLTRANLFKADLRDGSIAKADMGGNLLTMTMKVGPAELQEAR